MADTDEGIVLTDREREALAGLAASIEDPWLARQLTGVREPAASPARGPGWARPAWLPLASRWIGVALVLVGAVMAATTFVHSTVAASLGLMFMGLGLWRVADDHGERIVRRLAATARRGRARVNALP